ncbi:Spc97 / Spc98 family [Geosmithia morbida]|uniref:Spindle pole body component n=1 Tax=Geosmithia morbida TaxID=1094350 RepID=A0A9P4YTU3_9HYPO|nr:Spc97 / Spc98 family [Geosmithia morbida]KAF4122991.1 Spc97 / Spc98 family [Geosmithia morbida]
MLHEILLSLSGHPSPLLRDDIAAAGGDGGGADAGVRANSGAAAGITPSERQLLGTVSHLSAVHVRLMTSTAQIADSHPSAICRAVAAAIDSIHLSAFQRRVLDVEESILRGDADLVGAYNIVPLTAVVGEFRRWTRPMDWLWELVQFMSAASVGADGRPGPACHAAAVMDRLRSELQSGYDDIERTAMSLVEVAETAWLRQVSAWILYGRLPSFGADDFFVQRRRRGQHGDDDDDDGEGGEGKMEEFVCASSLLPSFVTARSASSMLFIGKSLNHVKVRSTMDSGGRGLHHLSSNLSQLSGLRFPLDSAAFSRAIASVRLSLSENMLQSVLPVSRVTETLQLLRDFFLLGRGEFAMALTHEADERNRNRWKRADRLTRDGGLGNVTVKEGEVAAVLSRTWSVLGALQGQHADEDEQLELARDLFRLHLVKPPSSPETAAAPSTTGLVTPESLHASLASSPFGSLLFSVPSQLSIHLPSPLDMILSPADLELYSCVNAYLLSIRRAHIRLTDLWKITSLRRHHPAPRGAREDAVELRQRWSARMTTMRSSWTTASAAIFFLGETEGYFQTEVVAGLWGGFHAWLTGPSSSSSASAKKEEGRDVEEEGREEEEEKEEDLWLNSDSDAETEGPPYHDPQTISTAHALYLQTLVYRLLLTQPCYTTALHALLVHIDHLVAHAHRLHAIFTALDLEADAGVVDAFVDLHAEEAEVTALMRGVEAKVKRGIADVVSALRHLETDVTFAAAWEGDGVVDATADSADSRHWAGDMRGEYAGYEPARVGGINRLLMKLEFGGWLGTVGEVEY